MPWWVWASLLAWAGVMVVASPEASPEAEADPLAAPDADPFRPKRQLLILKNMMHQVGNGVHYAAERFTQDVVPTVGHAVVKAANKVALRTAHGFQKGAQFVKHKVMPVIDDRFVAMGNAAVPVINRGWDALEAGLGISAQVVSEVTSETVNHLGYQVLGEKRHNRVKTIADNLSTGINNGLNSLAGTINTYNGNNYDTNDNYEDQDFNYYDDSRYSSGPRFNFPQPVQYEQPIKNLNQALQKVMGNTVYTISKHILGPNLTDAISPFTKSVTNAVGQTIPAVSFGSGREGFITDAEKRREEIRFCTTPNQDRGYCLDLSDCPNLLLDLTNLRKSVCFKSLFTPGVCCPSSEVDSTRLADRPVIAPTPIASRPPPPRPAASRPPQPPPFMQQHHQQTQQQQQQHQQHQQSFSQQFPHHQQQHRPQPIAQQQQNFPRPPPPIAATTQRPFAVSSTQQRFQCGTPVVPQFRIVGGEEARRGQWPWMVSIWLHGPRKTEFWCGGSLISEQYILTAAHCTKDSLSKTFDPQQFTVRLGDHNIFSTSDDHISNPQTFKVSEIRPHPDFKSHGFYNDVALLRLDRRVTFTEYVLPVCLPPPEMARQSLDALVGQTPSVIGWGSTYYGGQESSGLREAQLPIWTNEDCNQAYFQPIGDMFLCAGYVEGGRDACQGDSGGPLQLYYNGNWVQIGVVSFGNRCAEPGYPGVYTRVTKFVNWVYASMR